MTRRQLEARVANDMALARKEFARRLRAARENADLTQTQVAEKVGVDWATYQRWETAKTRPRPNKLAPIATALGVDPAHLQGPEEDTSTALEKLATLAEDNARALREIRVALDGLGGAAATATSEREDIARLIEHQARILERIEAAVTAQQDLADRAQAASDRISQAVRTLQADRATHPRSS